MAKSLLASMIPLRIASNAAQATILFIFIFSVDLNTAFRPIFIGGHFRKTSFISPGESNDLARECGKWNDTDDDLMHYPWAVSITIDGKNKLGGSLISPYHVLTVAHGFLTFHSYTTRCSNIDYRKPEEIRSRTVMYGGKCIRGRHRYLPNHPKCPESDVQHNTIRSVMFDGVFADGLCREGHDWAIIELENRVEFSERVRPICLPMQNTKLQNLLTVAGWGRNYVFRESGPLLRETHMLYTPHCPRPWSDLMPAKLPDLICATSLNRTDFFAERTCHGDSGSGMQQIDGRGRARLVGITSFGTSGCPANELARFTRVESYLVEICEYTGICYWNGADFPRPISMTEFIRRRL